MKILDQVVIEKYGVNIDMSYVKFKFMITNILWFVISILINLSVVWGMNTDIVNENYWVGVVLLGLFVVVLAIPFMVSVFFTITMFNNDSSWSKDFPNGIWVGWEE